MNVLITGGCGFVGANLSRLLLKKTRWDITLFDSVSIIGDTLSFDLAQNAYGSDDITVTLSDGLLVSSQTLWVNVTSQNDAPQILGTIPDFLKTEDSPFWIIDLTSYESDIEDKALGGRELTFDIYYTIKEKDPYSK